jgi:hypothetical protein
MVVVTVMADRVEAIDVLAGFREQLYQCMTRRADALFELADALLCTDGPVKTLVGLSLAPEHSRGHGALYDALKEGHQTPPHGLKHKLRTRSASRLTGPSSSPSDGDDRDLDPPALSIRI